jgi:hypothetical protein
MKCEEYRATGKFGGWVSENFLGFARVMLWFFQNVPNLNDSVGDSCDPGNLSFSLWNKKHFVYWLRVRQLKSAGTLVELKEKVKEIRKSGKIPPIIHTVAGEYIPEQVQRMLVALDEMISSIMITEVVPGKTVEHMELKIKLFLTEFDLLDQQVKTAKEKPKIITSFNFMCLLNLPQLTLRFGPLRNLWEGGYKGEGYISMCKRFLHNGQRHNFEQHAMTRILAEMSMRSLVAEFTGGRQSKTANKNTTWSEYLGWQRQNFEPYRTRDDMVVCLCHKGILSVVICRLPSNATVIFSVVKISKDDNNKLSAVFIDKGSSELGLVVDKMGSKYQSWYVSNGVTTSQQLADLFIFPSECCVSFGVLLPLLDPSNPNAPPKHTLVRSKRYGIV